LPVVPGPTPPSGTPPSPGTAPGAAVDDWIKTTIGQFVTQVASPSSWTNSQYWQSLAMATPATIQVAAILMGWRAGDRLTSSSATPADLDCLTNVWKLVGYRYNHEQLGKMVGYVFMILNGFLKSEAIQSVITTTPASTPVAAAQTDQVAIFQARIAAKLLQPPGSQRYTPDPVDELASRFTSLVSGELISIAANPGFDSQHSGINLTSAYALQSSMAFLKGFTKGMINAADSLFTEFYQQGMATGLQEGYSIGYSVGFRDGYSQGYAAGYQSGYSSGYNAQAANSGLNSIISGLGGAINDISGILSDPSVGTVLGVLGSLF
jgi:hypothetical protein